MAVVQLIEERRFDPSRRVSVEKGGRWWPGFQYAWRLCDDGHGWMAHVEFSTRYEWGSGKHLGSVTPDRVHLGEPSTSGG